MPINGIGRNKEFVVNVKDEAVLVQALAMVDKYIFENFEESHFTRRNAYVRSYLQLFWSPEENSIYEDINLFASSNKGMMPLQSNIDFNIYNDSEISLTSQA